MELTTPQEKFLHHHPPHPYSCADEIIMRIHPQRSLQKPLVIEDSNSLPFTIEPYEDKHPLDHPIRQPEITQKQVQLPLPTFIRTIPHLPNPKMEWVIQEIVESLSEGRDSFSHGSSNIFALLLSSVCHLLRVKADFFLNQLEYQKFAIMPKILHCFWSRRLRSPTHLESMADAADKAWVTLTTGSADFDMKIAPFPASELLELTSGLLHQYFETTICYPSKSRIIFSHPYDQSIFPKTIRMPITSFLIKIPLCYYNYPLSGSPIASAEITFPPNNPSMPILIIRFGLTDQILDNPDCSLPENPFSYIFFQLHITPAGLAGDLRAHPSLHNYQQITGEVTKGTVIFPRSAMEEVYYRPLKINQNLLEQNIPMMLTDIIRSLRRHIFFIFFKLVGSKCEIAVQKMLSAVPQANIGDIFPDDSMRIIQKAVELLFNNRQTISEAIIDELRQEFAAIALYHPFALGSILKNSGLFKLMTGFIGLTEKDISDAINFILEKIQQCLKKIYPFPDQNSNLDQVIFRYTQCLETIELIPVPMSKLINNYEFYLSPQIVPDGISLWVEALDLIRSQKGLEVPDKNYSILSRFCWYFGLKC